MEDLEMGLIQQDELGVRHVVYSDPDARPTNEPSQISLSNYVVFSQLHITRIAHYGSHKTSRTGYRAVWTSLLKPLIESRKVQAKRR